MLKHVQKMSIGCILLNLFQHFIFHTDTLFCLSYCGFFLQLRHNLNRVLVYQPDKFLY